MENFIDLLTFLWKWSARGRSSTELRQVGISRSFDFLIAAVYRHFALASIPR
jgi:hypothetical protein